MKPKISHTFSSLIEYFEKRKAIPYYDRPENEYENVIEKVSKLRKQIKRIFENEIEIGFDPLIDALEYLESEIRGNKDQDAIRDKISDICEQAVHLQIYLKCVFKKLL